MCEGTVDFTAGVAGTGTIIFGTGGGIGALDGVTGVAGGADRAGNMAVGDEARFGIGDVAFGLLVNGGAADPPGQAAQ